MREKIKDIGRLQRHVLVHGYYQIRPSQLWTTVVNDIPELKPYIEKYFSELSEG